MTIWKYKTVYDVTDQYSYGHYTVDKKYMRFSTLEKYVTGYNREDRKKITIYEYKNGKWIRRRFIVELGLY